MEDGRILDGQLNASSSEFGSPPKFGRLNGADMGWIPESNSLDQWIQVKFADKTVVTGIVTQGKRGGPKWVTRYRVLVSMDGIVWQNITTTDNETTQVCSQRLHNIKISRLCQTRNYL